MTIWRGSHYNVIFDLQQMLGGTPVDITGWKFRSQIRDKNSDKNYMIELTTENGGIRILDPSIGQFELVITAEQNNNFSLGNVVGDMFRTGIVPGPERLFGFRDRVRRPVTREGDSQVDGGGGSGSGYVSGPVSATDNGLVRFNGTTGKLVQDSVVTLDDTGAMNFFSDVAAINMGLNNDASVFYDAGYMAIYPGVAIYGRIDGFVWEYLALYEQGTRFKIDAQFTPGGVQRDITICASGVDIWEFDLNGGGHFNPVIDNTYDIGTDSLRPRTIYSGTTVSTVFTVSTLPAAGTMGRRAFVSDATTPTFLGTLTGGGAVKTPVFDDGTVWRAG